jgi:xylose isomerase
VALLQRAGKLFYVHLNDNDRNWDWDMLPGAYNFWDFIEFFYYLDLAGYKDDWFAFDVLSKEVDPVEHFQVTAKLTRRLEALANRIDSIQMKELSERRNPAEIMSYLYDTVIK